MSDQGSVFLVSGASGNLGQSVVAALAAQGARVVAADRRDARAGPDVALGVGGVDFLDPAACDALVAQALERFGRLDGVAHTVGGFTMVAAAEADPEAWERMFRLNLITTANLFRAALPPMRAAGRGSLVAVAAGAALSAGTRLGPYAASKAAVLRLVDAFAAETKAEGVRVNAVLPGTMDTPQNRAAMPRADTSRWVRTGEVAQAIAFLLGDGASGVTGAALPVTGRG